MSMAADPLDGLVVREPTGDDHRRVLAAIDPWWGGLGGEDASARRAMLVSRLFFQHFANTSMLVERDGELVGFLIGFLSQSQPDEAYIHFVWVSPELRGMGVGAALYQRFFALAKAHGRSVVRSVTSPSNRASVAFHRAMGFELEPGEEMVDDIPVLRDYGGPRADLVAFVRHLDG
jgi:ribosomal protein S18 acetylase RimI-like enzyme